MFTLTFPLFLMHKYNMVIIKHLKFLILKNLFKWLLSFQKNLTIANILVYSFAFVSVQSWT